LTGRARRVTLRNSRACLVRTMGVEPILPVGKRILSPLRLPFRHVRLTVNSMAYRQERSEDNSRGGQALPPGCHPLRWAETRAPIVGGSNAVLPAVDCLGDAPELDRSGYSATASPQQSQFPD